MQALPRLIRSPGVVMHSQTGFDFTFIGQINTTNCGVMPNFVVKVCQFCAVMFKSTHGKMII